MFFEIGLKRVVVVAPDKLQDGILQMAAMLRQLLEDVRRLKCSEDHGYYVVPTTLERVGDGKIRPFSGAVVYPVEFKCIVFKPHTNEILVGVVKAVLKHGCFVDCGPLTEIFLHVNFMKGFVFEGSESPEYARFISEESGCEIKKDTVVRFKVFALKWTEEEREFKTLATVDGDYLGPIQDQDPDPDQDHPNSTQF